METFNKIFQIQCILLIVFYLLENAHCDFFDNIPNMPGGGFPYAYFESKPQEAVENKPENPTTVSIIDRTEKMTNSSNQTDFPDSKGSSPFNDTTIIKNSSSSSYPEIAGSSDVDLNNNSVLINTEGSSTNEPFTTSVPNLKTEEITTQFFEPSTTVKSNDDESSVSTPSSNSTNESFTTLEPNLKSEELTTQFIEPSTTEEPTSTAVKSNDDESSVSTPSSNSTNESFTTLVPNLKSEELTTQFIEPSTTVESTSTAVKSNDDESSISTPSSNSTNESFTTLAPDLKIEEFTTQIFEPSTSVKPSDEESSVSTQSSNHLIDEPLTTSAPNLKIEEFTTQIFEPSTSVKPSDEESSVSTPSSNYNQSTNESFTTLAPNLKSQEFTKIFEPSTTVKPSDEESSVSTPSSNHSTNEPFTSSTPNLKIEEFTTRFFQPSTSVKLSDDESSVSTLSPNYDESTEAELNYFTTDSEITETTDFPANETSSVFSTDSAQIRKSETTSSVGDGEAKIENNSGVNETNAIVVNQESSISIPTSTIETTTNLINLVTKPGHIYSIPRKTPPSKTFPDFSSEDEIVGSSIIKSNIVIVSNPITRTYQTSETEKSPNSGDQPISTRTELAKTTEEAPSVCSLTIRTSMIDSVSKIIIEVLEKLRAMFNNVLGDTFDEVFNPMLHVLMGELASSLIDMQENVDEEIVSMVNSTLAIVSEKKSLAFGIISDSQQRLGWQTLNGTITDVFKKIESWVNEFSSVDTLDFPLMDEALRKISDLVNHTIDDFLHGVKEVSKGELDDSRNAKNLSTDVTNLIDDFLSHRRSNFEHIIDDSKPYAEAVDDLTKMTEKYKNIFLKDADSLLVDLLIHVNDKKGLYDKLLSDISLVLINLRKNLLEKVINGAKITKIISDLDEFEKSSLLDIKFIVYQIFPQDSGSKSSSNISRSIENQVRDTIRAVKISFDDLKNLSSRTENVPVSDTSCVIQMSLYGAIWTLQKEFPPVLDIHLLNSSNSLNVSALSPTFDGILRNYSEQLVVCENAHAAVDDPTNEINFSTSRGIFTYPFEYLLLFAILFSNLL